MKLIAKSSLVLSALIFVVASLPAQLPDSPTGRRGNALIEALRGDPETIRYDFFEEHLAPELLASRTPDQWTDWWRERVEDLGGLDLRGANKTGPFSATLMGSAAASGAAVEIHYELEPDEPHRIIGLEFETGEPVPAMSTGELAGAVDRRLTALAAEDSFSGVALISHGDDILFERAYGLANRRFDVENRTGTAFNLGSINKIFTKIALAQLASAGRLSLDDTIADHLPSYPNREVAERVTLQQLATHTSGLGDIFTEEYASASKRSFRDPEDYFRLFASQPLLFEPGEGERYSNGGYMVLGAIVAAVSGVPYHEYVRTHILEPAGMDQTRPWALDDAEAPIATGYTRMANDHGDAPLHENTLHIPHTGTPAGGGYSTVRDLLALRNALAGGTLLDPRHTEWLLSNQLPERAPGGPIRLGMGIAGGGPGVNATLEMDGDWTIVVLTNLDPPSAGEAARALRELVGAVERGAG